MIFNAVFLQGVLFVVTLQVLEEFFDEGLCIVAAGLQDDLEFSAPRLITFKVQQIINIYFIRHLGFPAQVQLVQPVVDPLLYVQPLLQLLAVIFDSHSGLALLDAPVAPRGTVTPARGGVQLPQFMGCHRIVGTAKGRTSALPVLFLEVPLRALIQCRCPVLYELLGCCCGGCTAECSPVRRAASNVCSGVFRLKVLCTEGVDGIPCKHSVFTGVLLVKAL